MRALQAGRAVTKRFAFMFLETKENASENVFLHCIVTI